MDAFLELFPVVAFFVAYFVTGQDFFVATIVILVAVAIQINRDFGNRRGAYADRLAQVVFAAIEPGPQAP